MSDVVVRLPVHEGEEAQLFGSFLASFMESRGQEAETWDDTCDAPYLIVRSDPQTDVEMKVVIFQQPRVAQAFSRGWAKITARLANRL
jgi:hypothetical protein